MKIPDPAIEEKIIEMAALVGAQTALVTYEEKQQEAERYRRDKRLRNTRLLLRHYRMFHDHVAESISGESQLQGKEYNALDILYGIDDDVEEELYIEAIRRTQVRTRIIIEHIDHMLELYKIYCEKAGKEERRRYRVIHAMYIAREPMEPEDICEKENIAERTFYRDLNTAVKTLSALIFGIDGLKLK